jgi:hypothetical protein
MRLSIIENFILSLQKYKKLVKNGNFKQVYIVRKG